MNLNVDLTESDQFRVKISHDSQDLLSALRLRHEIFYVEMQSKKNSFEMDFDDFDLSSEHLIVEDKSSKEIVACCRLRRSKNTSRFYSSQEFDLSEFLKNPRAKVELGRVCIRKDHRSGAVVFLLWRGLAEFMKLNQIQLLFGCCSLPGLDITRAEQILGEIRSMGKLNEVYQVSPTASYSVDAALVPVASEEVPSETLSEGLGLAPLLQIYLSIGCQVAGPPAFDRAFNCTDFLVFLDLKNLNKRISRKMRILQ